MAKEARLTINLAPDEMNRLTDLAEQLGQSVSATVRNGIQSGFRDPRLFMPLMPTETTRGAHGERA